MKFCADIRGPRMMNPNDFGDHVTFPGATLRLTFLFFCEMFQQLLDGLPQNR